MDIEKFVRNLKVDKLLHFICGIISVDIVFILLHMFFGNTLSIILAFATATFVMAGKELIWDKLLKKGVCSIKDFIAGEIGIVYATLVCLLIEYI